MRILQLIGDLEGAGAERVVTQLSEGLHARGVFSAIGARSGGALERDLTVSDVHLVPKRRTVDRQHLSSLVALAKELDVDVVHSHLFGNNLYGLLAAKFVGARSVLTVHGWDCLGSRQRRLAYKVMARLADAVVTVSHALCADFVARTRVPVRAVTVVLNGVDVGRLRPRGTRRATRLELGVPDGAPLIGAVGNTKPVKGYDVLLRAFPTIRSAHPGARLLFVGLTADPTYRSELDWLCRSIGVADDVRFLGPRPDIPDLLEALDVFVLPSRSEGTSMALLEAMAASKAIVATAVGGTPAVVRDGEEALLVPPDDPAALAARVGELLADAELAARCGRRAFATVNERFGVDTMVDRYISLYHRVLGHADYDS